MINLDIVRIHDTPMKLVLKGQEVYGAFWYGDAFFNRNSFTPEMNETLKKYEESKCISSVQH